MDRHTAAGLAAIVLWSATVAVGRSLSEQLGPLTAAAAVYLTGGLLLLGPYLARGGWRRRLRRTSPAYLFGCGTLFLAYTAALFLGLGLASSRQQAIEVGLVNYLWPTLTLVLALPLLSQRATMALVPGTLSALLGVFLVVTHQSAVTWETFRANVQANPSAYGLGLAAAITWALYSNLARRWSRPDGAGAVPLFILATGLTLAGASGWRGESCPWNLRAAAEAGFLGGATALSYVLWDAAMRRGNLVLVASCSYFTPLLSTVVSCAYLGVAPGGRLWVGCLLIVAGSLISWRSLAVGDAGSALQ